MTWDVALILGIDGMANGAVYLLAGLGLVLIFSVTRVVFVPFGDVAAFAALSLAAFESGRLPPTVGLVAMLALLAVVAEVWGLVRRGETARIPRAVLGWGVLPLVPCALAWALAGHAVPHAVFIVLAILLVVPITPLVARVALQPIADASVLVLLIASLALHFLLSGLGLLFFGPEGFRTAPLASGSLTLPGGFPVRKLTVGASIIPAASNTIPPVRKKRRLMQKRRATTSCLRMQTESFSSAEALIAEKRKFSPAFSTDARLPPETFPARALPLFTPIPRART